MGDTKLKGRVKLNPNCLSAEAERLKRFLEDKIVSQRRAIERIVLAYERWLSPIWIPERPIITALFLGPSGVGKTRLAEVLAEFFFDSRSALTKIECANFKERHEVSKLIGSPPGYVGYGETPLLAQETIDRPAILHQIALLQLNDKQIIKLEEEIQELNEKLRKCDNKEDRKLLMRELNQKIESVNIYASAAIYGKRLVSIILFDEFEKGHDSLRHVLLEIASHGRTRLGTGRETLFYNSFVILTSNVASRIIADAITNRGIIGFIAEKKGDTDYEQVIYERATKELKDYVEPEFLGRIEKNVVVFAPLSPNDLAEIMDRETSRFIGHLATTYPIELMVSKEAKDFILKQALDHPEYGARLIIDKIEKYLIGPIAMMINSGQIAKADRVFAELDAEKIVFFKDTESKLFPGPSEQGK